MATCEQDGGTRSTNVDKVLHSSTKGIADKAIELDRNHNETNPPYAAKPGRSQKNTADATCRPTDKTTHATHSATSEESGKSSSEQRS